MTGWKSATARSRQGETVEDVMEGVRLRHPLGVLFPV